MIKINKKKNSGYALLELLFYIAFLVTFSLTVINAMIVMAQSFRETSIQEEFMQGGVIMEKISREIRQADDINTIGAGSLKLNTTDADDLAKTVQFLLSGSDIEFFENDVLTANLNTTNITITDLSFTSITTTKGKAVRVIFSISSNNDNQNRIQNFYDTVVLRGSY